MKRTIIALICAFILNLTAHAVKWTEILPSNPGYTSLEKIDVDKAVKEYMSELSDISPIEIVSNELILESVKREGLTYKFDFRYVGSLPDIVTLTDVVGYIMSSLCTDDLQNIYLCMMNALYSYYDLELNITDNSQITNSILLKQDGSLVNKSMPEVPKDVLETVEVTTIEIVDDESDNIGNSDDEDIVYEAVEEAPEFPGGKQGLMKWLSENVDYPTSAFENNIQGQVQVQFVIRKDGSVDNIKIVKSSADVSLDKEAMRVVKNMPKWTPGKNNGKFVSSYFTLPVNFRLTSVAK